MDVLRALIERVTARLLIYWGLLLGGIWLFVELADEVYGQADIPFDEAVLSWMTTIRHPTLDSVMIAFSTIGNVLPMLVISIIGAVFFWRYRRREGVFFALSMAGAVGIMTLTKYVLGRDRPELFPDPTLWFESSPSFPSGHATGSFALFLTVLLIMYRKRPSWGPFVAILGFAFAFGVTFSRLYLQVHYPSDVIAGWALGAFWVLGLNYFFTRDRDVRTVVLSLPASTVSTYRRVAQERGVDETEFVDRALNEHAIRLKTAERDGSSRTPVPLRPKDAPPPN